MARAKVTSLKAILEFKANLAKAKKIANAHAKATGVDPKRFLGTVFLAHGDGSVFLFDSAYAVTWCPDFKTKEGFVLDGFALIITEHHGNLVYPMDEVKTLRAYGPRAHIQRYVAP